MSAEPSTASSGCGETPPGTSSSEARPRTETHRDAASPPRYLTTRLPGGRGPSAAGALHIAASRVANALVAVAFGPRCAACLEVLDAPLDGPVCASCWEAVRLVAPPACRLCGQALPSWRTLGQATEVCKTCRRRPPAFDGGAVACEYEGALRAIVHAFKYDGRRSLARPLGLALRAAGERVLDGADAVVPVPLHPLKRLRRGFNQSADLARLLGPPTRRLLWRVRPTRPQAGLKPGDRRRNVEGAFAVAPWLSRDARRTLIEERVLVLVDDVMTTGATLDACAQALKRAGAQEVRALTLARALPDRLGTSRRSA